MPDTGVRFDVRAVCGAGGLSSIPAFFGAWSMGTPDPSGWFKVPRWWMMLSFHVCVVLMILVTVELILRALLRLFGAAQALPIISDEAQAGAE